ncbi:MAG: hypothetical protein EOO31_10875 [Comamonadaceae bacterium]|nr:MAG: hypothetical protein EOO31_10875 [Comamonadaceae bacterium]
MFLFGGGRRYCGCRAFPFGCCWAFLSRGRVSPRRARYFSLLRQRNVPKRKATLLSASPSLRYGATCGARSRGGAVELTTRLQRFVRAAPASQFTKRVCPAAHPPTPRPVLLGAYRREGRRFGSSLCSTWPSRLRLRRAHALPQAGAERSDGPSQEPTPCGRAEKRSAAGAHECRRTRMLRELTRRGCLNEAQSAQ